MSLPVPAPDHSAMQPPAAPLLTVDQFMRTVLTAVLDTPVARRELAALFLAASASWEVAVREHGWRRAAAPPQPPGAGTSGPARRRHRWPEPDPSSRDAEQRALAAFCTHAGHFCVACGGVRPIEGVRFACAHCGSVPRSLCSVCRRSGARCGGDNLTDCRFLVYEHPWESDVEYAPGNPHAPVDVLKVPRAPLGVGDEGPRVMHLHYVLYKMGYLKVGDEALRVGVFCEETRLTIARFQRDHMLIAGARAGDAAVTVRRPNSPISILVPRIEAGVVAQGSGIGDRDVQESLGLREEPVLQQPWGQFRDQPGVFTALTRLTILNIVNDVESRYSQLRCRDSETTRRTHLPAATAA